MRCSHFFLLLHFEEDEIVPSLPLTPFGLFSLSDDRTGPYPGVGPRVVIEEKRNMLRRSAYGPIRMNVVNW